MNYNTPDENIQVTQVNNINNRDRDFLKNKADSYIAYTHKMKELEKENNKLSFALDKCQSNFISSDNYTIKNHKDFSKIITKAMLKSKCAVTKDNINRYIVKKYPEIKKDYIRKLVIKNMGNVPLEDHPDFKDFIKKYGLKHINTSK